MIDWCTIVHLLAQLAPQAAPEGGAAGAPQSGPFGGWNCLLMGLLPLMLVYLMLMTKPKSRDQASTKEMLTNLKKNDRVVTAGGIIGVIVNANPESESVTVRVDESNNTKLVILKSSIARVLTDNGEKSSES
jgi:preprotein translocase subunit YajC